MRWLRFIDFGEGGTEVPSPKQFPLLARFSLFQAISDGPFLFRHAGLSSPFLSPAFGWEIAKIFICRTTVRPFLSRDDVLNACVF
jgi:hypothetical protein